MGDMRNAYKILVANLKGRFLGAYYRAVDLKEIRR
jgi:hypothetical protein